METQQQLSQASKTLQIRPRLSVYTEEANETDGLASLMGSAQDEKADNKEGSGDTIIGKIRSLINRYPRKLLKAQK